MKAKILGLAVGVALSGMISAGVMPEMVQATGGELVAIVNCPAGSKRNGSAPTYADCNLPEEMPTKDVPTVAQTVIKVLVSVVGIVAVLVIVIGGILYVISIGDTAKTKRAQNAIMYGVIGLLVAVLAYAIVNFVLGSVF